MVSSVAPSDFNQACSSLTKRPDVIYSPNCLSEQDLLVIVGDVQAAGSPDGGLASVAEGSQKEGRKGVVAASEPALVKPAKLADQALADFNAEMADLGEEIHTAYASHHY